MRIQKWQDGEIVKTLQGKYQYVKEAYKSRLYSTVADLVKYESDKTSKRSASNTKGKAGKKVTQKPTETPVVKDKEQDE